MVIQTYPIPANWREEFEKARKDGFGNGAPAQKQSVDRPADIEAGKAARNAVEQLDNKYVRMPQTISGAPRFASRSDGVEAGIVNGGFVPPAPGN